MIGSTRAVGRSGGLAVGLVLCLLTAGPAVRLSAQSVLEQFSSENLRPSAVSVAFGVLSGTNILGTTAGAIRVDAGRVAPNVRVLLGGSYFRGTLSGTALHRFEQRLRSIVRDPSGDDTISLGRITWSDLTGDLDLQYVLPQGRGVTVHTGLGLSVHVRNGGGQAIRGTFVEDALDAITAGLNATLGAEFGARRWRVVLEGRGVVASGLSTVGISAGLGYRWVGVR